MTFYKFAVKIAKSRRAAFDAMEGADHDEFIAAKAQYEVLIQVQADLQKMWSTMCHGRVEPLPKEFPL